MSSVQIHSDGLSIKDRIRVLQNNPTSEPELQDSHVKNCVKLFTNESPQSNRSLAAIRKQVNLLKAMLRNSAHKSDEELTSLRVKLRKIRDSLEAIGELTVQKDRREKKNIDKDISDCLTLLRGHDGRVTFEENVQIFNGIHETIQENPEEIVDEIVENQGEKSTNGIQEN